MLVRDILELEKDRFDDFEGMLAKFSDEDLSLPLVVPGVVYSASLIKDKCRRRVFYNKATEIEPEEEDGESPWMLRGKKGHKAIEDYLLDESDKIIDGLACRNEEYLSQVREEVRAGRAEVEQWMNIDLGHLGRITGKQDVSLPAGFIDHKFTSKKERILSPIVLEKDSQCRLYSYERLMKGGFEADHITPEFHYYITKGRAYHQIVKFDFDKSSILKAFQEELHKIVGIFIDLQRDGISLLPRNTRECRYCKYAWHCESVTGNEGVASMLANTKSQSKLPPSRPKERKVYTPKESGMAFDRSKFLNRIKNKSTERSEETAVDPPDNPEPTPEPKVKTGRVVNELDDIGLVPSLVSALKDELGVVTQEEAAKLTDQQLGELHGVGKATIDKFRAIFPYPEGHGPEASEPEPNEEPEEKKGDDDKEAEIQRIMASQKAAAEKVKVEMAEKSEEMQELRSAQPKGLYLYIDCVPDVEFTFLSQMDAYQTALQNVAKSLKVPHYSGVDFGKGAAAVVGEFMAIAEIDNLRLVISTKSKAEHAIAEALMSYAAHVVRGAYI